MSAVKYAYQTYWVNKMRTIRQRIGILSVTALVVGAIYSFSTTKEIAVEPEVGALLSSSLPAECQTPLFKEISEISTHSDDSRLVEHADLLSRCKQEINDLVEATSRVRLIDREIAPLEGLLNFETPHVHPIDLTPDKNTLLVVNTAAAALEVFSVSGDSLSLIDTIPVGIDPVSVRARTNNEVWVVNQISDSVSIVDLEQGTVIKTLVTENEPADVIFAGAPLRAFVTASEVNHLNVFSLDNLDAAPQIVALNGEDPRALAVSNDGSTVYAAIFESSNDTRLLNNVVVGNDPNQDDNDVAIINANNLNVSYQRSLMNMVMGLAVNPSSGQVSAVGTQSLNEIAQEPNLNGIFVQVHMANFAANGSAASIVDLNPHLDYNTKSIPPAQRIQSIGDPRAIAFNAEGTERYIVGMGSNNMIVTDASGNRLGLVDLGSGPTGIVVNTDSGLAYVLNRFAGSVSVVDLQQREETAEYEYYDPTPARINAGRVFVYNTHVSSGLGQAACASCHVDARTDRLGWDLGDPSGANVSVPQGSNNTGLATGGNFELSALKGVMVTQSLQDIMQHPSLHWRGDKEDINGFNATFTNLMGADAQMSQAAMDTMADYLATIWFPPNPYRGIDDSRPRTVTLPDGSSVTARASLNGLSGDNNNNNNCLRCHTASMTETRNLNANNEIGSHIMSPALTGIYDKIGLEYGRAGFGFFHDGSADVKRASRFNVSENDPGLLAELLTLDSPTGPLTGGARRLVPHAGVGQQLTLNGSVDGVDLGRLNQFMQIATDSEYAALIAKARIEGKTRGFVYRNGEVFDADRLGDTQTKNQLIAIAESGAAVTFTLVAEGTEYRLGLDIDNDGVLDGELVDAENTAPNLLNPGVQSDEIGGIVSLQISANDLEQDVLLYSATALPSSLSIDASTGLISGTLSTSGSYTVTVTVSDGITSSAASFAWVVSGTDQTLLLGEPRANDIATSEWHYYKFSVDDSIERVRFELSNMTDDGDLYVRRGARPTGDVSNGGSYDGHSVLGGSSSEVVELSNEGATDWYVGVHGWRGTGYQLEAFSFASTGGGDTGGGSADETLLTDSVALNGQVSIGDWTYFKIEATDNHSRLDVDLEGLQADADLYVRSSARPSGHQGNSGVYDCGSFRGGTSTEHCSLENTGATTWFIGVYGYRASSFSIQASLEESNTGGGDTGGGDDDDRGLTMDQVSEDAIALGMWHYYVLDVPAGDTQLDVVMSGLSADVDLYVRADSRPSGGVDDNGLYDCGSFVGGSASESCTLNVSEGRYYVAVHGYRASPYRLLATSSNQSVQIVELSNGVTVTGNVAQGEWVYYKLDSEAINNFLVTDLMGLTADIDLYVRLGQPPSGDPANGANADCNSVLGGTSAERCEVSTSGEQSWFVGVYGYQAGSYSLAAVSSKAATRSIKNDELSKGRVVKEAESVETKAVTLGSGGGSVGGFWMLLVALLMLRRRAQYG